MTITLDQLLTVRQVAEFCGVWRSGVYKAISEHRLPTIEWNGKIYVTREAAKAWKALDSRQRKIRK